MAPESKTLEQKFIKEMCILLPLYLSVLSFFNVCRIGALMHRFQGTVSFYSVHECCYKNIYYNVLCKNN